MTTGNAITEQLRKVELAINYADNEGISRLFKLFGFDTTKMKRGREVLEFAKATVGASCSAKKALQDAMAVKKSAEISAREAFQGLVQTVKTALGQEALTSLGLSNAMPHSCAAFLAAGYALFDTIRNFPDVPSKLAIAGYDPQKLERERNKLSAYAREDHALENAKAGLQQVIDTNNNSIKNLQDWFTEYCKVARVALCDKKQFLEELGIEGSITSKSAVKPEGAQK